MPGRKAKDEENNRQKHMKNILFYITGHGYGHATRCIEVLKKLTGDETDYFCHLKTNAPEWLFQANLSQKFQYNYLFGDVGAVQKDWLTVDKKLTLATFDELWQDKSMLVERELKHVRQNQIDLIIGDIPPIAFEISKAAGVPGIGMGNFTWDWIYEPYIAELPHYAYLIDSIKQAYSKADLLLRLPFYGDMSAFKNIVDVPLVGRKAVRPARDVQKMLPETFDQTKPLVIIALRKDDLARINLNNLQRLKNYQFLIFEKDISQNGNLLCLPQDFLPFQELVNAADAVISKLGYGIVSECILNQTPLLYSDRYDFAEHEVLRNGLTENGVSNYIPLTDFLAGNWQKYLQDVFEAPAHWPAFKTDGIDFIHSKINEYIS